MQHTKNLLNQLKSNQSGVIAVMGALLIAFVIIGVLALSIDHGTNLTRRASLDQKLHLITKQAAREYIWYVLRRDCAITDIPNQDRLLLANATTLKEHEALEHLRNFILAALQRSTSSTDSIGDKIAVPIVDIRTNDAGRKLLNVEATIPQECKFSRNNCGNVRVTSRTTLPFGSNASHTTPMVMQYVMAPNLSSIKALADTGIINQVINELEACTKKASLNDLSNISTGAIVNTPTSFPCPEGESPATLVRLGINTIDEKSQHLRNPRTALLYIGACPDDSIVYRHECHNKNVTFMDWPPKDRNEQTNKNPKKRTTVQRHPSQLHRSRTGHDRSPQPCRPRLGHHRRPLPQIPLRQRRSPKKHV